MFILNFYQDLRYLRYYMRCWGSITTLTFTFLTNFKINNFNKEHMSSLKMI